MDRRATARETLAIMERGFYEIQGQRIEIGEVQERAIKGSFLLTPDQGEELLKVQKKSDVCKEAAHFTGIVWDCSTVEAILKLAAEEKSEIGVLNFASAKNPGGGFINGAMAQEESIAASSCLYKTLLVHEDYYKNNRACGTMMYTDHAIYSPEVIFFRDGKFQLLQKPVTASVLTLPAVNMGQVVKWGEDVKQAEMVMKRRMKLSLAIFSQQKCRHLILGAYGCGVFRNDPRKIAKWWKELLDGDFAGEFSTIIFAILDNSASRVCIRAFQEIFGSGDSTNFMEIGQS